MISPMNITTTANPAEPFKSRGANEAQGFDLYAELFAGFFPVAQAGQMENAVVPEYLTQGDGQVLDGSDQFGGLPSGFDADTTPQSVESDGTEVDLYAEMLSAFFPVPTVASPSQPLPEATAVNENEIPGDPFAQTAPENTDGPHLLPTGESIAADATEFASAKPAPADSLDILGLNASARSKRRIDDAVDEKLKMLGKAKGNPLIQRVIGRDERLPVGQGGAVCVMPTTKGKVETNFIVPRTKAINGLLPINGNSTDGSEGPVEVEILELPTPPPPPPKHEVSIEEAEPILELTSAASSDGNFSAPADSAHLISAVPAAVQHRHETEGIVTSPFRPERIELENNKKVEPATGQASTLLQMFTNRVLVDARSSQTARTLVKEGLEAETAAPILADTLAENEQADGEAGFSFDTSVGGETKSAKPELPQLSDAKTRRVVLDQVGSQLNDLAAAQKPGDDKRVLTIKLSPAELGTVEITLSKSADGVIDAHFQTDNPHAQHAINETLAQLRDSLERSGMQVGSLNTSCTSSYSNPQGGADGREAKHFGAAGSTLSADSTIDSPQKSEGDSDRLVSLRA
jgi:hypothetical protein